MTVIDAVLVLTHLPADLRVLLTLHLGHQRSEDAKIKVQQHNKHIFLTLTPSRRLSTVEVFELFQYSAFSSASTVQFFDSYQQSKTAPALG